MIVDHKLVLKEAQALTANGTTDAVAVDNAMLKAKPAYVRAKITTAGAGIGSVRFAVEIDGVEVQAGIDIDAVDLKVGTEIKVPIPAMEGNSIRGKVIVTSTVSAGAAFMDICVD